MNREIPKGMTKMGDDIQNSKTTAEDLAIERAEQQLAAPDAMNMQFLQSTLNTAEFQNLGANTGFTAASAKNIIPSISHSGQGFSGLSPAYSGAGLLGAVAAADMGSAGSAMGVAAQVASAAPVTFGKNSVGESATLANLGDKALAQPADLSRLADNSPLLKPVANADGSMVPMSAEFTQLMAMLESGGTGVSPDDALMSLIGDLGGNPSAESLQQAIEAVLDQIELLNSTFEPVFDGLSGDVQSQVSAQNGLSSTDLGFSILDDGGSVSTSLTDLLGTLNVGSNPQLDSLLNLDSTFDDIASLVGSLPDLDLSPVIDPIVDPVIDPIIDIVDGVTDPVIDPIIDIVDGVTDPVIDPIIDIVDGVTDPVIDPIIDIVDGVTDPVVDPIIDIVDGVTDPVIDPIIDPIIDIVDDVTDPVIDPVIDVVDGVLPDLGLLSGLSSSQSSDSDTGLLDSLSSGISSNAGSEGGALDGLLGAIDPNK